MRGIRVTFTATKSGIICLTILGTMLVINIASQYDLERKRRESIKLIDECNNRIRKSINEERNLLELEREVRDEIKIEKASSSGVIHLS